MNILILKGKRRIFVQQCLDVGVAANSIDQPTLLQLLLVLLVLLSLLLVGLNLRTEDSALSSSKTVPPGLVSSPASGKRICNNRSFFLLFQPLQDLRHNFMDAEFGTKGAKSRRGYFGTTGVSSLKTETI